jgi:TolA-binding protein
MLSALFTGVAIAGTTVPASATPTPTSTPTSTLLGQMTPSAESQAYKVDRAALAAQQEAVNKFFSLAAKYKNTFREPTLLAKLIEAQRIAADMEFRIAHGSALLKKKAINLTKYDGRLKGIILVATEIISHYPRSEAIEQIYFERGHSYEELKQKNQARADYEFIAQHFPKTRWAVRSNMAMARFSEEERDFPQAIVYLKRVETETGDDHYPFALYQLAWDNFSLGDVTAAIVYLKRQIVFYRDKREQSPDKTLTPSEESLWSHSLRDMTTFYFEGYEKKMANYELDEAMPYFRSLQPGEMLGKMTVAFANLLRSRELTGPLNDWKNKCVSEEPARPETLEVVSLNLDYLLSRKLYNRFESAIQDFKELDTQTSHKIRKYESYQTAQNSLLAAAEAVQKRMSQISDSAEAVKLCAVLKTIYDGFIFITDDSDPRLCLAHYNMAESLFRVKDYEGATQSYLWVVEHWQKEAHLTLSEVKLKMIGSRYKVLEEQKLLATEIKPAPLSESGDGDLSALNKLVGQWIGWIDSYLSDFGREPAAIEAYEFESDRILYVKGQTKAAVERMLALVRQSPSSKSAQPAASLVLDTLLLNKKWEDSIELADKLKAVPTLGNADFKSRLTKIPEDTYYVMLQEKYQSKDFHKVIEDGGTYVKRYPKSERVADCLFLASRAAGELKDKKQAHDLLTELLTKFPDSENRPAALLAQAEYEENVYEFDSALENYRQYLLIPIGKGITESERDRVAQRSFLMSWLAKKPKPTNCDRFRGDDDLKGQCDQYQALVLLQIGANASDEETWVKRALKGKKENRAIWAAVGLMYGSRLGMKDRLTLAEVLASGWKDEDRLIQFSLIPAVNQLIPGVFAYARKMLSTIAPLNASSAALERRIELIRSVEDSAGKVVGVPWAQVKVATLATVAQIYIEFSDELGRLPVPKDITPDELATYQKSIKEILDPFRAKGKALNKQAVDMAKEVSVRVADIPGLSVPSPRKLAMAPQPFDLTVLDKVDGAHAWSTTKAKTDDDLEGVLRDFWVDALQTRAWGRLAFFFQEYKDKVSPKDSIQGLMQALFLDSAGARSESIAQLESTATSLQGPARTAVKRTLCSEYLGTSTPGKANQIADELAKEDPVVTEQKEKKQ